MERRDFMKTFYVSLFGAALVPGKGFSYSEGERLKKPEPQPIKIIGVGTMGASIIEMLYPLNIEGAELIVIDTNPATIVYSPIFKKYHLAPGSYKGHSSRYYDPSIGLNGVIREKPGLTNLIKGAEYVIFVSYIGGNTGSGALPGLIEIAGQTLGIKCSAVISTDYTIHAEQSNRPVIESISSKVEELIIINNDYIIKRCHDGCKHLRVWEELNWIDDRVFVATLELYGRKRAMLKI